MTTELPISSFIMFSIIFSIISVVALGLVLSVGVTAFLIAFVILMTIFFGCLKMHDMDCSRDDQWLRFKSNRDRNGSS